MPEISFVITAHNDDKEIDECLESVHKLSGDYEFIVIDDGSTDKTLNICTEWANRDLRFTVISQKNMGVSVARNAGLKRSKSEWIVFIDGDDYLDAEVFKRDIVPKLDVSYDVIFFQNIRLVGNGRFQPDSFNRDQIISEQEIDNLRCKIINMNEPSISIKGVSFAAPWGKAYRRAFLEEHAILFIPEIIRKQDFLFNLLASRFINNALIVPGCAYIYRQRGARTYQYNPHLLESDQKLLRITQQIVDGFQNQRISNSLNAFLVEHLITMLRLEFFNSTNPAPFSVRRRMLIQYMMKEPMRHIVLERSEGLEIAADQRLILFLMRHRFYLLLNIYYRSEMLSRMGLKILYRLKQKDK